MNDNVVSHLREARAILAEETQAGKGSREISLAITKIDEAILWRNEDHRLKESSQVKTNNPERKSVPIAGVVKEAYGK